MKIKILRPDNSKIMLEESNNIIEFDDFIYAHKENIFNIDGWYLVNWGTAVASELLVLNGELHSFGARYKNKDPYRYWIDRPDFGTHEFKTKEDAERWLKLRSFE